MTASPSPWPIRDADTDPFWEGVERGQLLLQRCGRCGRHQYYPRAVCSHCSADDLAWVPTEGRGTLYSFTVSRRAPYPQFADRVPYVVGLVDLDEGPRMLANVVGTEPEELAIGDPMTVAFIEVDDGVVLPAFRRTSASD